MTDESKPLPETTELREARPRDSETSGSHPKAPIPAKPTHGDPDRRSIGDENDRGLRRDTQSAGSRSIDDRSKPSEQQGKQQKSGTSGFGSNEPLQGGGERSASGKEAQPKRSDSQGDRPSK